MHGLVQVLYYAQVEVCPVDDGDGLGRLDERGIGLGSACGDIVRMLAGNDDFAE